MRTFTGLDELAAAAGTDLGSTEWQTVEQRQIDEFAELTGDRHWIHVDPDRARREGPFGGTILHGAMTLALGTAFLTRLLTVTGVGLVLNYGLEGARLRTPVPVGARVRGTGRLVQTRPLGPGLQVAAHIAVEVEGERRPASQAEQLLVVYR
jgi:acyl dehydratase